MRRGVHRCQPQRAPPRSDGDPQRCRGRPTAAARVHRERQQRVPGPALPGPRAGRSGENRARRRAPRRGRGTSRDGPRWTGQWESLTPRGPTRAGAGTPGEDARGPRPTSRLDAAGRGPARGPGEPSSPHCPLAHTSPVQPRPQPLQRTLTARTSPRPRDPPACGPRGGAGTLCCRLLCYPGRGPGTPSAPLACPALSPAQTDPSRSALCGTAVVHSPQEGPPFLKLGPQA